MAMNNQLLAVVQHIESERGVSREIVLTAIEQAISQAAKKNRDVTNDLRVVIDRKDLSLHVFDTLVASDEDTGPGFISIARAVRANHGKPVAEGETIEIEMPASRLGRIAAQTSRQMIMQKIREAERTNTFSEYRDRVGDIVSGTVSAVAHRDIYVTVGKTEMILPGKERIPTEDFQVGDPIRAIILRVDPEAKGPSVILSRASGKFVEALFRLEVSEIADGVVEIMGVSRDPGYRAKLAVRTSNENVDPVGACVCQRGSRVRAIVNELSGEKIDIVPLYFAAPRPVVVRDGNIIMVDDERFPIREGETPEIKSVRFRTLGCYPLTGGIESTATTLDEIIDETLSAVSSERTSRVIDNEAAGSMERRKREGYF